jgi:hypothetical protein
MVQQQVREFGEYQFGPRSILRPGDRLRVRGGPVYGTENGETLGMYERGILVFRGYFELGSRKWIKAYKVDGGGVVIQWVGKSIKSPVVPGLRRRPYRVKSKVGETRRQRALRRAACTQKKQRVRQKSKG